MAVLSLAAGLFGCQGAAEHSVKDICKITLWRGHETFDESYSFDLKEKNGEWLFSAECVLDGNDEAVSVERLKIAQADADDILKIIEEQKLINFAKNYKEREEEYFADDEASCCFSLEFKNGEAVFAKESPGKELEHTFYRLAEKYKQ